MSIVGEAASTLPAAIREIARLRGVCDDWAEKYAGWRDACLAAESERDRLQRLAKDIESLASGSERQATFCRTLSGGEALQAAACHDAFAESLREVLAKVAAP